MQAAIIDHQLHRITVFDIPDDVKEPGEYIECLPGYCYWSDQYMVSDEPIEIRVGKQSDFPEFHVQILNDRDA